MPTFNIYVDPETGDEYTEDELDPEMIQLSRPESSFFDAAKSRLSRGYNEMLAGFSGFGNVVGEGLQNAFGQERDSNSIWDFSDEPKPEFFKSISDYGGSLAGKSKYLTDLYTNRALEAEGDVAIDTSTFGGATKDFVTNMIPGAARTIPPLALAAATKNPSLLAPSFIVPNVIEGYGRDYTTNREAGLSSRGANLLATEQAIPNILTSMALNPIGGGGAIKNVLSQQLQNVGSNVLEAGNRSLTNQAFLEGNGVTLDRTLEDTIEGSLSSRAIAEGTGATLASNVGARFLPRRASVPDDTDGMHKPINDLKTSDPDVLNLDTLEGIVTDLEPQLKQQFVDDFKFDEPTPVDDAKKIKSLKSNKNFPDPIKGLNEEPQTVVKKTEDIPVEAEPIDPTLDSERAEDYAMFDEALDPVKPPPDATTAGLEDFLNTKKGIAQEGEAKRAKVSQTLLPFVDANVLPIDKALAVSDGIPEANFGERAAPLQKEFIQKASADLSETNLRALANDAANIENVRESYALKSSAVDLTNKLDAYRVEIDKFVIKTIDTKNPYLKGLNTKKHIKAINDEYAAALNAHDDPSLLTLLDNLPAEQVVKLAKDRIIAKQRGSLPLGVTDNPLNPGNIIKSEKGSIELPPIGYEKIAKLKETISDNITKYTSPEAAYEDMFQRIQEEFGVYEELSRKPNKFIRRDIDRFLDGEVSDSDLPEAAKLPLRALRKWYKQSKKVANLDPTTTALFDTRQTRMFDTNIQQHKSLADAADLLNLKDPTLLNKIVQMRRIKSEKAFSEGKRITFSDDSYRKLGADDATIAAIHSHDKVLGNLWKYIVYHAEDFVTKYIKDPVERDAKVKQLKEWAKAKELTYYTPFTREGDWAVYMVHKETQKPVYTRHKTEREAKAVSRKLLKSGFEGGRVNSDGTLSEYYKWEPPTDAAYANVPDELLLEINNLIEDPSIKGKGLKLKGFKTHLLRSQGTEGANPNVKENVTKYIVGATEMGTRWKYQAKENALLKSIPDGPARVWAKDWIDYTNTYSNEGQVIRSMLSQSTLGFLHVPSGAMNFTQVLTNGVPELTRFVDKGFMGAEREFLKASKLFAQYKANPKTFKQKNPKLYSAIEYANRTGVTGDTAMHFLHGMDPITGERKLGRTLSDAGLIFQRAGETFNRTTSFIAGYNNAPASERNKVKFASDFSNRVNVDLSKLNRPKRARGAVLATSYAMEMYSHNWTSNYLDSMRAMIGGAGDVVTGKGTSRLSKEGAAFTKYNLYTGLLGGLKAVPGISVAIATANLVGVDLEKEIREYVKNPTVANILLYGPLFEIFGINISNSLSQTQGLEWEGSAGDTVLNQMGGLAYQQVLKIPKTIQAYESGVPGEFVAAQLPFMPRTISNALKAKAYKDRGGMFNSKGDIYLEDPTEMDLLKEAIGFQGRSKTLAREQDQSIYLQNKERSSITEGAQGKIANAFINKNPEKAKEIVLYMLQNGIPPKLVAEKLGKSLVEEVLKKNNPKYRQYKASTKDKRLNTLRILRDPNYEP